MVFHPLQRVYSNGFAGICTTMSKVLGTPSDVCVLGSCISNCIHQHASRRHHYWYQGWHQYPRENSLKSHFLNSAAIRLRAKHFHGWIQRKNTRLSTSMNESNTITNKFNHNMISSFNFSALSSVMPAATKRPTMKTVLGCKWVDEYAWMQQGFSEELTQYIKEENNFSDGYFNHLKAMQEKLRADILQYEEADCDSESDLKVIGNYAYYPSISESGSIVFCRRNIRTGEDQILLDSNDLMELFGYNQVIITAFKISPYQHYLGAVVEGSPDVYDGHIIKMDGSRQSLLVECIHDISNMEFLGEDSVLYTKPFKLQAREVWRHQIGTSQKNDELVLEEMDERFFVDLSHTKDRRYIAINCNSRTTSELWLIDCHKSSSETDPLLLWPRQDNVECYLDHCGHALFALSNSGDSSELELFKAQTSNYCHGNQTVTWEKLYSPPPGHVIQDLDVFASHCILALLVNNIPQLAIVQHSGDRKPVHIELPPDYTTILPGLNANINATHYHFQLSSPLHPPKSFELDLETCNIEVQESYEDTGSEDEGQNVHSFISRSKVGFACKRLMAQSQDGTNVPITVFHQESMVFDGRHPMLVIGYGAYRRNVEMDYTAERMALVSKGWVLAFCHVRGGGELGKEWYCSGKGDQKHHSFEDFESCIEFLHSSGFSQPALTAAWAASAGAVLLGALCNQRPELLKAVVMRMPFVDVLSSMLDSNSPLTSQDLEEWGDPRGSATELDYIASYCPYHNLRSQHSLLIPACPCSLTRSYLIPSILSICLPHSLCLFPSLSLSLSLSLRLFPFPSFSSCFCHLFLHHYHQPDQTYPSILITSSMNDQRVPPWIPAKYLARLRDRTRNHHEHRVPTFLLKMHADGGHFGPDEGNGGVDQALMEWAFLHQELSLDY